MLSMADDVWPMPPKGPGSLYSFNGIGFDLRGKTRTDAHNRCFATRWFTLVGLPVLPLGRYYITERGATSSHGQHTATYEFHGKSRLRIAEVLQMYLFCWVVIPVVVLLPAFLLISHVDEVTAATSFWVVIAGVAGCPLGGFALLGGWRTSTEVPP